MIDPEFFRRHMDFRSSGPAGNDFSSPTLPSARSNMTRLCLNTVGRRFMYRGANSAKASEARTLQAHCAASLSEYRTRQRPGRDEEFSIGDSIVRDFSVLGKDFVALEQDASLYIQETENSKLCKYPEIRFCKY